MLFRWGTFKSAAGLDLDFKIECDALTEEDWDCIARACLPSLPKFKAVVPVPRGGIPLARAFEPHITPDAQVTLIVDDVWTTGRSFMKIAETIDYWAGCIAFARHHVPAGVLAFMRLDTLPKRIRIVPQLTAKWDQLGPMPTDPEIEARLTQIKHD